MEFCVISPTAGLEKYSVLSKWHLMLSHIDDKAYLDFYERRKAAGDFIILDNGSYERGYPQLHPSRIQQFANVAVLPDFLLQPWRKTWHAAIAWLDEFYEQLPGIEFLYIPQSLPGDLHGFIESYQEAVSDRRITWLGIPRAMAYAITDNPLARVEFARMVHRDHPGLKLHAFGMVNGDIHELPYLAAAGVTSIDSSAPVWRGWHGYDIKRTAAWDMFGKAVDFNHNVKGWEQNHELILANLEACGVNTSTPTR